MHHIDHIEAVYEQDFDHPQNIPKQKVRVRRAGFEGQCYFHQMDLLSVQSIQTTCNIAHFCSLNYSAPQMEHV